MTARLLPDADEGFAGPDLPFQGAGTDPSFSGAGGCVVDIDGRTWDFDLPGLSPTVAVPMAHAFAAMLSRNSRSASRLRTNRLSHGHVRSFLKFVADKPGRDQDLGRGLLRSYKDHLFRRYSAVTAYGRYNTVRRCVAHLIDKKLCHEFPIPRNEGKARVNAAAKIRSGHTFATVFAAWASGPTSDAESTNERLLRGLCDLLWEELEALQARPDIGKAGPATNLFMACTIGLLAAACVNPFSIATLEVDNLRVDDRNPALRRLVFDKPRAGADVPLPPFPLGGASARTLPRLWERVVWVSDEMRRRAPAGLKGVLLLRYDRWGGVTWFDDCALAKSTGLLRKCILGSYRVADGPEWTCFPSATAGQERYAAFRGNAGRITYSVIRNTAINVANARLGRNAAATQRAVGHRPGSSATDGYLNNWHNQEDLDRELRRGQAFIGAWAAKPAVVLPPDPNSIASSTGADPETAEKAARDDLNLGMGASLVNGQTVVIDTPLNALRMMQWLEMLKAAEQRLSSDNPERWRNVYEPQLELFEHALHDFSYRSMEEARRLSEEIQLPFPAVV